MTVLQTLIEAVETGTLRDIDWSWGAFPDDLSWDQVTAAYDGSVDAALALMEAVLPRWFWRITSGKHSIDAVVQLDIMSGQHHEATADTPARALLLAILKAMEATNAGKE